VTNLADAQTGRSRNATRRRFLAVAFLLIVVPAVAYAPSLGAPFHYDDLHSILRNPHLKVENAVAFFADPSLFDENPRTRMYRPIVLVSYAIDDLFWGRNPFGFHLTNLLLHLTIGAAIFALLTRLLRDRRAPLRDGLATLGAAAFLLHPLVSEGVIYVSCRSSQLAALGYLGALYAYVRGRQVAAPRDRVAWFAVSLVSAAVAFGSKAIAITLPGALVLVEVLWLGSRPWRRAEWIRTALTLTPFVLLAVGYLVLRQEVMGSTGVNLTAHRFVQEGHELTGGRSVRANLLTQSVVFWKYVWLTVWPAHLNIAHHVPVAHRLAEPRVWLSVLGLLLYGAAIVACLRRRLPWIAFALAWLPLTLSPTSSIVPLNVVMSEHRLYLPLTLFLALLAVAVGERLWTAKESSIRWYRGLVGFALVIAVVWGGRTSYRSVDYVDGARLWGKAVAEAPDNFRARNYLGNAFVARGDFLAAREQYRAAEKLYPEHMDTRINLGEASLRLARSGKDPAAWDEGERTLRSVINDEPRHVLARLKLGRLLFLRHKTVRDRPQDLDWAEAEFLKVIEIARQPRFLGARTWARFRLADLYEYRGDLEAAERVLRAILAEAPFNDRARKRLREIHAVMAGSG